MPVTDIILIVLVSIFVIAFTIYSINFFWHRKLIYQEYRIKNQFNAISQYLAVNHFRYLEHLAHKSDLLKKVLDLARKNFESVNKQANILKSKIIDLTATNSHHQYYLSTKQINEINSDIKTLNKLINDLKKFLSSSTKYFRDIHDFISEFRTITDTLFRFTKINIYLLPNNVSYYDQVSNITNQIKDINLYSDDVESDKLLVNVNTLTKMMKGFYDTIEHNFIFQNVIKYLKDISEQVDQALNIKKIEFSQNDMTQIQKTYSSGKTHLNNFEKDFINNSIKDFNSHLYIACKDLVEVINRIENEDRGKIILEDSIKLLDQQIEILQQDAKMITNILDNIHQHFTSASDQEILTRSSTIKNNFISIIKRYEVAKDEFAKTSILPRQQIFKTINDICDAIYAWKFSTNDLIKDIEKKYREQMYIINSLADAKIILLQIKFIQSHFHDANSETIDITINNINDLQNTIAKDYYGQSTNVLSEINSIQTQVNEIIKKCHNYNLLKLYAERLIFFSNKFRRDDNNVKRALTEAEDFYTNNKYEQSIQTLINVLKPVVKKYQEK